MSQEDSKTLKMQELTITELIRKNKILELYSGYWNDDIPLKPHFKFEEVRPILEDAAEIVSRIRYYVDTVINKDSMFTLRTNDGTANRYLFYTENNPTEEPEKFLRDLVIASLSSMSTNDNQLENGVSLELIDAFITAFQAYKKELDESGKARQRYESYSKENLLELLKESSHLAELIFESENEDRDHHEEKIFLKAMVKSIENYYLYLLRYQQNSKFNHAIESPTSSEICIDDFVIIEREVEDVSHPSAESPLSTPYVESKPEIESEKTMDKGEEVMEKIVEKSGDAEEEKSTEKLEDRMENDEKAESKMEEQSAEPQSKEPEKEKASSFIKIAKIETDIENTMNELDSLRDTIHSLKLDYSDPRGALHSVEDLLRKCLYWGEALMKDLLTLDSFSDYPQAETKAIRKKQAVEIQKLMDDLEELKQPLKTHQTALFKLVHQLDEEEKKMNEEKQKQLEKEMEEQKKKELEEKISKEIDEEIKKRFEDQRKTARKPRKTPPSAFPFLPTEIQNIFNMADESEREENEERGEEEERDPLRPLVDLLNPNLKRKPATKAAQAQQAHPRPAQIAPHSPAKKPVFKDVEENIGEEEMEEEPGLVEEEEEEEVDLYYSLIRQWKVLKFEPHFETERQRGRFLITSNIPGMREDDFHIQINERNSSLTISGCRLPSRKEFENLKENLIRRFRFSSQRELTKTLFRYGIHRYGTFASTLSLPRNVIFAKIEAKYEDGSLIVIAPFSAKKQIPVHSSRIHDDFSNPFYQHGGYRNNNNYSPSDFYAPTNFFY